VGEVDDVGGYLDGDADRDAEVPGVDVQVNHGDREIVGNGPAERGLHHPAQVGVTEHIPDLHGDVTPELNGVTFDKIAGTGHVRPRGLPALHNAHPDPDRGDEVTEQVASGPAGTRRRPLPVIFAEPGDDAGEEVESSIQELSGQAAHRSPPRVRDQPCRPPWLASTSNPEPLRQTNSGMQR
jgi:hypothetical protein